MRKVCLIALLTVCLGAAFFIGVAAAAEEVPKITPDQLKAMLGDANVVIIDVRLGTDWNDSDAKIKGSVRENPMQVNSWMNKYPKDKTLVFYCA
jgi:rhodanese-related sulfurtransferase